MELILGIDDAGRGPIIGPMVLAGCLIDKKIEKELKKLGVKDSKQLTPKRREFLDEKIKELAETFEVVIVQPETIDGKIGDKSRIKLNEIEASACAEIINKINILPNSRNAKIKVVVDCPSTNLTTWTDTLKREIKNLSNLEIFCEHKADQNHLSVSAASILAKNAREKEMASLREKYGKELGSGYTSDSTTREFIKKNSSKYKNEGIFRKSWKTWQDLHINKEQKKLGDF
jgi:ribonuclease HII